MISLRAIPGWRKPCKYEVFLGSELGILCNDVCDLFIQARFSIYIVVVVSLKEPIHGIDSLPVVDDRNEQKFSCW
jgi:hypothetical protein